MYSCHILIGQRESLTCRVLIRKLSKVSNVSPSNFRITIFSLGGYFVLNVCYINKFTLFLFVIYFRVKKKKSHLKVR